MLTCLWVWKRIIPESAWYDGHNSRITNLLADPRCRDAELLTHHFHRIFWICQQAVNWLKQDDPSAVVWDEIVGYLITMIAAPAGWQWMLLGFVLFRLFDIWKPWPISLADRKLHGGFGIMLDDVIAGVFAAMVLQLCHYLL